MRTCTHVCTCSRMCDLVSAMCVCRYGYLKWQTRKTSALKYNVILLLRSLLFPFFLLELWGHLRLVWSLLKRFSSVFRFYTLAIDWPVELKKTSWQHPGTLFQLLWILTKCSSSKIILTGAFFMYIQWWWQIYVPNAWLFQTDDGGRLLVQFCWNGSFHIHDRSWANLVYICDRCIVRVSCFQWDNSLPSHKSAVLEHLHWSQLKEPKTCFPHYQRMQYVWGLKEARCSSSMLSICF